MYNVKKYNYFQNIHKIEKFLRQIHISSPDKSYTQHFSMNIFQEPKKMLFFLVIVTCHNIHELKSTF